MTRKRNLLEDCSRANPLDESKLWLLRSRDGEALGWGGLGTLDMLGARTSPSPVPSPRGWSWGWKANPADGYGGVDGVEGGVNRELVLLRQSRMLEKVWECCRRAVAGTELAELEAEALAAAPGHDLDVGEVLQFVSQSDGVVLQTSVHGRLGTEAGVPEAAAFENTEAYCGWRGRRWESSRTRARDPTPQDSATGGGPGGAGRRGMPLEEGGKRSAGLPCRSGHWGVEQGLGEELTGDTRLRGGPGEEAGEGLDRERRHLETEGGSGRRRHKQRGSAYNKSLSTLKKMPMDEKTP
ncbi:hypothetical protein EYF80_049967 [Liparis tanakae]|uniref:Uncharacterized protein n=1 Tax=Liparis tanakae TaxID=230148 RepID=A0A4Z2FGG8_9TELE|nr:hypothetical protein EYF80_049967 [Liparis tanakae]